MSPDSEFIATSVANHLLSRMRRTRERRRISIFAGPPGIGKTTAINRLKAEAPFHVATVTIPPARVGGIMPTQAIQLTIEAVNECLNCPYGLVVQRTSYEVRRELSNMMDRWSWIGEDGIKIDNILREKKEEPKLTLIFDEAQNLSRTAIETIRFLNDNGGGYSKFPIGIIFVGNNEFVLENDARGISFLSEAVADRALYTETLNYGDVKNDDIALFLESRGMCDDDAVKLVVAHFSAGRADRSFRRASDLLEEIEEEADGKSVTPEIVRIVLGLK